MKKITAFAPLALLLLALQQTVPQKSPLATQVYASIGSRGANCSGSGICTIGTSSGQAPPPTGYKALLGYDEQGSLYLEFEKSNLPTTVLNAYFDSDFFQMQSDCPIPSLVLRSIEAKDTAFALPSGIFPLSKSSQAVRILFEK